MDSQLPNPLGEFAVACCDGARITECTEVLGWVEREGAQLTARADRFTGFVECTDRLRRVVNERCAVLLRNRAERI